MFRLSLLPFMLLLLLPAPAPADEDALFFALPSSGSSQAVLEMWDPLLSDMAQALGRPVRGKVCEEYAGVVWALREGQADLAWLGNKGAIEAVDRAGAEVGAQVINSNGVNGYHAHLITRKDAPFDNVDDVIARAHGLTFGYGDPNSTSGSLVPGYYLFASRGLAPLQLFKRVTRAGHEDNFLAVAHGKVDVATNNSADLARLKERFPDEAEAIKVIWTSPRIPSDPLLWRGDLDQALMRDILDFLTRYGRPEGKSAQQIQRERAVLDRLTWTGFKPSDDAQLVPVRKLKLFKELLQTRSDMSRSEAQRRERVQALESRLQSLERRQ